MRDQRIDDSQTFSVRIERDEKHPWFVRVHVCGHLDSLTAPQFEESITPLFDTGVKTIVFDLSALQFISSAGLRVMFYARRRMISKDGSCALVHPRPQVEKVLEIIDALPDMQIFKSTEEMDAYLAVIQEKVLNGTINQD